MDYLLNNKKDLVQAESQPIYTVATQASVGDVTILDGVEVVCINTNPYIFVDKNHDLSYYCVGSDCVDSNDFNHSPGTFGYEWGGYGTETGITATAVGTGLSNTNALIEMNLQPNESGWWVIWDKVNEFRQSHSDKWFVPSKDELNLVYENRSNLSNLSFNTKYYYWSSSEHSSYFAWYQFFNSGNQNNNNKNNHNNRVRLCSQIEKSNSRMRNFMFLIFYL